MLDRQIRSDYYPELDSQIIEKIVDTQFANQEDDSRVSGRAETQAEADRDELRASLQSAMKNAWQGMVSPTIQKLISELQAEVNKLNAKKTEVQASHTILSEMEKAISDHHCEVCDQNLTDEWAHHLQMKLDDLKSSHPALTEDERTSLDLMQKKISALRGVKLNVDVRSIQATSDSLNRIEIQISNLAQELSDIEKQIRTFGKKVPGRSAGFEHVVALSLIGALHKNAPLQGPVIMDSPFGRLDPTHKRNVTKTLPKLSDQVILLVYDGEIDPNQTREILGGNLIKEYRLNRVTSFNTKID